MSFIGNLLGKVFGTSVAEPINAAKELIKSLYLTTAEKAEQRNTLDQLQAEVCKVEAAHANWFVAGARPALIWVCVAALAIYWIPQYSLASFFFVRDTLIQGHLVAYQLSAETLFKLIGSLIGLGVIHKLTK